jgi:hypothetical protein
MPHLFRYLGCCICSPARGLARHCGQESGLICSDCLVFVIQWGEFPGEGVESAVLDVRVGIASLYWHVDIKQVAVEIERPLVEGATVRVWVDYAGEAVSAAVQKGCTRSSRHPYRRRRIRWIISCLCTFVSLLYHLDIPALSQPTKIPEEYAGIVGTVWDRKIDVSGVAVHAWGSLAKVGLNHVRYQKRGNTVWEVVRCLSTRMQVVPSYT